MSTADYYSFRNFFSIYVHFLILQNTHFDTSFILHNFRDLALVPTHKPTTGHSDPQETEWTFHHCDNLLLWHFHPVTFYYCDTSSPIWYVQVSNVYPPPCWMFSYCVSKFTFFYLDCDRTPTFALKRNVDVLSLGHTWKCFGLFGRSGQNFAMVKIRVWWWDTLTHGSACVCSNLT